MGIWALGHVAVPSRHSGRVDEARSEYSCLWDNKQICEYKTLRTTEPSVKVLKLDLPIAAKENIVRRSTLFFVAFTQTESFTMYLIGSGALVDPFCSTFVGFVLRQSFYMILGLHLLRGRILQILHRQFCTLDENGLSSTLGPLLSSWYLALHFPAASMNRSGYPRYCPCWVPFLILCEYFSMYCKLLRSFILLRNLYLC